MPILSILLATVHSQAPWRRKICDRLSQGCRRAVKSNPTPLMLKNRIVSDEHATELNEKLSLHSRMRRLSCRGFGSGSDVDVPRSRGRRTPLPWMAKS